MIFHDVYLLSCVAELDRLGALVDSGAGFLAFKWSLRNVLLGVVLKHFALFERVPGAMQHACLFRTGQRISRMAYITFLALASADLLGVGLQGVSFSLFRSFQNWHSRIMSVECF